MSNKNNQKSYKAYAIVSVFNKLFPTETFAEHIAAELASQKKNVSIFDVRNSTIILKFKRDVIITRDLVLSTLKKVMREMTEDENFISDISETYEFDFDVNMIDDDFISNVLNVLINGYRMIYISFDQ